MERAIEHAAGQSRRAVPHAAPARGLFARRQRRCGAEVQINGRPVAVEWSRAAVDALARRAHPLALELNFSCLVKKFVRFHELAPARETVAAGDKLRIVFRPVTSTVCSMELAERLGRQPETEIDSPAARKLAPRRFWIDHRGGAFAAECWI